MKPKSSGVWKYFSVCEKEKAKCLMCEKIFSRKGRTTSGLITHLKLKHGDDYTKMKEVQSQVIATSYSSTKTPLQAQKKQITIKDSLKNSNKWDFNNSRSIGIDKLIGEMIAVQDLPFNFVEGIGFKRLMSSVVPCYKLRGRDFFTNYVCETLYEEIKAQVLKLLSTYSKLSFTTDIWSEPSANVSLVSLTAHGISMDFKRVNIILKCKSIEGSHTGDVIHSTIISILNEWEIAEKVHCIVHDKGSNMIRAMNLTNFMHINCSVHQLQLCVKNALNVEEIVEIIAANRKLVSHFNHSLLAQHKLHNIQKDRLNQQPLSVVQDCPTR